MNILQALDSPELFGDAFQGESWNTWRAVLAAAFGLDLTDEQRAIFHQVAGDREPPTERVRELWAIAGRRSAKTHMAGAIAVYLATIGAALEGLTDKLSTGERGVISILACDRQQAKVAYQYVVGLIEASPILLRMVSKIGPEAIELTNRVTIEIGTNSYRSIRGRTLLATVFDECAFWRSDSTQNPDQEVYRAAVPGLATTNGMLISISSPYSRRGLMFQKHRRHFGQDGDVLVVQGPTSLFNPTLNPQVIADALADDPEAAKSEWLGEFRSDIAAFISRDVIDQCTRPRPLILPRREGLAYVAFVDVAGGGADEYTMSICHREGDRAVIDGLWAERGDPAKITGAYAKILKSYGIRRVTGDRYAAQWPVQEFAKHGIRLDPSELNRSAIYLEALPLLQTGRIELPPDERMQVQLTMLERRTGRTGRDQIDHGPSGHDDRANAACGAATLAIQHKREIPNVKITFAY